MIDTKEVWRKINSTDPMDHIDLHATIMTLLPSLLNRLEVAESDCLEQARLNGMGASREAALMAKLEAAEKERDELRAKIEAMEKQEPDAWCATDETGTVVEALGMNQSRRFDTALYLAPGAQPAPSVPAGWKLVPIDSTSEMDDAGSDHCDGYRSTAEAVWSAMIAAAPEAKP